MRILIVSVAPLREELGAAQGTMNLAAALRGLGHSVRLWTPHPLSSAIHWTVQLREVCSKLRAVLVSGEQFDFVDCSAHLVALVRGCSSRAHTKWVARSVQPDLLYLWNDLRSVLTGRRRSVASLAAAAGWTAGVGALVCAGWRASDVVMCLGSTERSWMSGRFPSLRSKLRSYDAAVSDDARLELAKVRRRRARSPGGSVRYIWIGRWAAHKGTDTLMRYLRERVDEGTEDVFTIAGCGVEGERALQPLMGSGRIRVIPSFARSALPELLSVHDAGLFTSHAEGWGLVLNEMVEAGLPVYATEAGGVADIRSVLGSFLDVFPPARKARLPPPPTDEAFARYEARFRWQVIASRYVESISGRA